MKRRNYQKTGVSKGGGGIRVMEKIMSYEKFKGLPS